MPGRSVRTSRIRGYLAKRFTAPKGQCHNCKKPLPPYRRRWCSDECSNLYLGLSSTQIGRQMAFKKSQACALCEHPVHVRVSPGALGYKEEPFTWQVQSVVGEPFYTRSEKWPVGFEPMFPPDSYGWPRWRQVRDPGAKDAELDHVVPLAEGGDHDWHNLRLLCVSCHDKESAALAERLAAARRAEKAGRGDRT